MPYAMPSPIGEHRGVAIGTERRRPSLPATGRCIRLRVASVATTDDRPLPDSSPRPIGRTLPTQAVAAINRDIRRCNRVGLQRTHPIGVGRRRTGSSSCKEPSPTWSSAFADSPTTTAEVHQHVSLRMLRLLAGDTEKALEPIPHISPTEQDYWSRQLFALATYLDHHSQPDDKRRAAASVTHLDEAVSHLRELGSLSLRNLSFCKNVYGYGAIETYESDTFSPGQQVSLYVEVENYHSTSSEKGFCTSLGSTYELLDDKGKRVSERRVSGRQRLLPQPATRLSHSIRADAAGEPGPGPLPAATGRQGPPERQDRQRHGVVRNSRRAEVDAASRSGRP